MTTIYRYRKETHFAQPPEAIWPFLADTARLNEMTGSPPDFGVRFRCPS